jgi:hypothetical protein
MAGEYVAQMRPLIAAGKLSEIRKLTAAFQSKVVAYLDNALGFADGAARARSKLAAYTASSSAYDDLLKLMCVLHGRDALAKFNSELPKDIAKFDIVQVAKVTALLDAFCHHHPKVLPFALALVAQRLTTFWQLIRLATKAAASKNAADIAATPYAIAVTMVLDRLEDKGTALRAALRDNEVAVARNLLVDVYDAEYALHVRIDHLERSDWGLRLHTVMNRIEALVDEETSRFPKEVGHVLGSPNLRGHESLAGRLTYFGWKGRDTLSRGAARLLKLIG